MNQLPAHGRISCTKCFDGHVEFDISKRSDGDWRVTANPLAWGNQEPEIVVLGFSKGPTQAGALARTPHNAIAYKGSRTNVGKILAHVGLMPEAAAHDGGDLVSQAVKSTTGRFHFGSLIRCTVERFDKKASCWKGSGGGMLDKFAASSLGRTVAPNCAERFLSTLPHKTKLVVMFGLGTGLNYVRECFSLLGTARGGSWSWLNDVAYTDGKIVVVHVEHFASQGALIPCWLGQRPSDRSRLGQAAKDAVRSAVPTCSDA